MRDQIAQFEAENVVATKKEQPALLQQSIKPKQPFDALNQIFPSRQEENRIQQARRIMGDEVKDLSDDELDVFLTEFQYLIDSWLDEFERKVFDNKTLKEVLSGR